MSDEAQAHEPRRSGRNLRISLDAMGGDFGPAVTVPGAALALERHPDCEFLLFGRESEVNAELDKHPKLKARARVIHADVVVSMDEKPSQALRHGRYKSSMWMSIDAVRKGEADVCCSAGNTGALMVMARFCLRMMPGIDRPALACMWPTARGESIVLDVGASIGATAENLVDMAIMGSAMARIVFDLERPNVGLLNVGVEEIKGVEQVKEAGSILREANLPNMHYIGFVEGDDIGKGRSDVVVTEGFAGNIALKTAEGTAKQIGDYLRSAIQSSFLAKIGYLLARGAFNALRKKMDPRRVNGAVFLGLNGVVVKSHGGTDALGFASAVDVAYDMAKYDLMAKIGSALAERGEWVLPGASSAMVENRAGEDPADRETGSA
ncbi:MAG: phosphate acyltransferase PlsX [Beijerinckiaceae bacterium]|nr:phosphate acyltransferase PlsX [Beijerinckiaceae bacterium]